MHLALAANSGLIAVFTRFALFGAEWVMWVLIALSMLSIGVMFERARYFRRLRDDLGALGRTMSAKLRQGHLNEARILLRASPSPAALVALAGLAHDDDGPEARANAMQAELARVRPSLERNLSFLGTVGNNAPFVGLLGTVIGIIQSFDALKPPTGRTAAAAQAAAQAATSRVMGTIAEALVATAVGLLVAIPAVAAFNYFQRTVKGQLAQTETLTQLVLSHAHALHDRELRTHRAHLEQSSAPGTPAMAISHAPVQAQA
ncbi:MAG: MotA/TolQ/ExbB proton channel family protein [Deltaproteobacteria bacterium]|nr:MotA/TolQ/ExbB proton channel family protein [Deltaproteobacteria bacterium]